MTQHSELCAAAIRVAEAAHRSRYLGEGDDDLGPAMQEYYRLRTEAPDLLPQNAREVSAERTANAAQAFLRSAQSRGSVQKDITTEMRDAVEGWENDR